MNKRKQEKPGGREVGTLPAHLRLPELGMPSGPACSCQPANLEQESDRCKEVGARTSPPPFTGSSTSRGRCQAAHTASVAHGLWMFETLPHSLKATLWSPPVASHDGELQGSKGEQQCLGVGGGEGCEWGKGALVPWLRPGGGRQGPSPINDWVSQHQHSQHAAGIPAALSRPTDGPWCPHPPEARARLQKRPVPSG